MTLLERAFPPEWDEEELTKGQLRALVRVDRGIRDLDRVKPDWRDRISLEDLMMESIHYCVLGQVFGRFGKGTRALGDLKVWQTIRRGFESGVGPQSSTYEELDWAWRYRLMGGTT